LRLIGKTRPSLEHLITLARIFDTTTDALLECEPSAPAERHAAANIILRQLSSERTELALTILRVLAK
jgi:hypothetical protein